NTAGCAGRPGCSPSLPGTATDAARSDVSASLFRPSNRRRTGFSKARQTLADVTVATSGPVRRKSRACPATREGGQRGPPARSEAQAQGRGVTAVVQDRKSVV